MSMSQKHDLTMLFGWVMAVQVILAAFQNVLNRIDFRIASPDVAQCHYNLEMLYGTLHHLRDVWPQPGKRP